MDNISDEMLAAYLDGNATSEEREIISNSGIDIPSYEVVQSYANIGTPNDFDMDIDANPYLQSYPDTCAIKSQQLILNDFGIPCSEDDLVRYSAEHGWYNGNGTSMEDVGKLLEDAGIQCTRQCDANVFNLVSELSQGHKVIVGVDSGELWGNRFTEWLKDFFLGVTPDHVLLVTGIDTNDPNNVKVIVTDPGTGEVGKSYPLVQFMDAWSDASCYMCSTNDPVPSTVPGMENFDYLEGHISDIAGIDYFQFQMFNDLSMGLPVSIPQMHITEPFLPTGEYAQWDGPMLNSDFPISTLVDAYFDVAHHQVSMQSIFHDYGFNQYLDTSVVNGFMSDSLNTGISNLSLDPALSWDAYAMNNGISGEVSNLDYSNYLNDTVQSLYAIGDFQNAGILDQQLFMIDYCNEYNLNFYDTFYC